MAATLQIRQKGGDTCRIKNKKNYSVNLGWQMTDTLQQKPYEYLKPGNQVVRIPAKSLIQITRSIKESWANVSFSATIKNENTGELHIITGKWKGTLNFSNYSVSLNQKDF